MFCKLWRDLNPERYSSTDNGERFLLARHHIAEQHKLELEAGQADGRPVSCRQLKYNLFAKLYLFHVERD